MGVILEVTDGDASVSLNLPPTPSNVITLVEPHTEVVVNDNPESVTIEVLQGAEGVPGAVWITGTSNPTTQGAPGDWYVNTSTYDIFEKVGLTWTPRGNIRGKQGYSRYLVEVDGVYEERPPVPGPVTFLGESNPELAGLMLVGDSWINTATDGSGAPAYMIADTTPPVLATNYASNPKLTKTSAPAVVETSLLGYGGTGTAVNVATAPMIDLDYLGADGYVEFSGAAGTAKAPAPTTLGDVDIRMLVTHETWASRTTAFHETLYSQWNDASGTRFIIWIHADGTQRVVTDDANSVRHDATFPVDLRPFLKKDVPQWIRFTIQMNVSNGSVYKVYSSEDGVAWTERSSAAGASGAISGWKATTLQEVGAYGNGGNHRLNGKVHRAEVRNGINGQVISNFIADDFADKAVSGATATDSIGNVWTLNGVGTKVHKGKVAWIPGTLGNHISTPDVTDVRITGDIDIRAKVSMEDWTPTSSQTIVSKYDGTGNNKSYLLWVDTTGGLRFYWTTDGSTAQTFLSSPLSVTNGSALWVRVTFDVNPGTLKFYQSNDGVTWTQVGNDIATGVTSIYPGTAPVSIGAYNNGSGNMTKGKVLSAQVRDGINGPIVANFKPELFTAPGTTANIPAAKKFTNLVSNPSFETTPIGNAGVNATTRTVSTTQKLFGTSSAKVVWVTGSGGSQFAAPVKPNTTYTVSMYVYSESGQLPGWTVANQDYGNGSAMPTIPGAGAWYRLEKVYTTDATASLIYVYNTVSSDSTYYVDGAMVVEGNNPGLPYFDGSTTPASKGQTIRWTGGTNTSTSELFDEYDVLAENFIKNPSMEVDANTWADRVNAALVRTTSQFKSGVASLQVTARATAGTTSVTSPQQLNAIPTLPGQTWNASVSVKSGTTARNSAVYLEWWNSAGQYIGSANGTNTATSTSSWTTLNITGTAPANTAYVSMMWEHFGLTAGDVMYADEVSLVKGTDTSWFDGAKSNDGTYEYRWAGTANASISQRVTKATKTWTINRSGDATTEMIDRNTWSFTGAEYLQFPDRDELDFGTKDFSVAANLFTRSTGEGRIIAKRGGSYGAGWDLNVGGIGTPQVFSQIGAAGYAPSTQASSVPRGQWTSLLGGISGANVWSRSQGTTVNAAKLSETVSNSLPLLIGSMTTSMSANQTTEGQIGWTATFRRALTSTEITEIEAWDGRIKTEPVWLRSAAALYVNADDVTTRYLYRTYNYVYNLADGFTGATPAASGLTYAWTGTAYQSTATKTAPTVRNGVTNNSPSGQVYSVYDETLGRYVAGVRAANQYAYIGIDINAAVAPGDDVTLLLRVKSDRNFIRLVDRSVAYGTAGYTNTLTLTPNQWTWVKVTRKLQSTGVRTFDLGYESNQIEDFSEFRVANILLVKGTEFYGDYFDGDDPGATWTGTSNASPSNKIFPNKNDLFENRLPAKTNNALLLPDATQTSGWKFSSALFLEGTGFPEGVVTAPVGSRYIDTAATNGAIEWIKSSGTGNTGWKVVCGDTGNRAVMTWDSAGVITGTNYFGSGITVAPGVAGGLYVQRRGDVVTLRLSAVHFTTASGGYLTGLPAGFNMVQNGGTYIFPIGPTTYRTIARPGYTYLSGSTQPQTTPNGMGSAVDFPTNDAWPVTLPGVAG